MKNIRTMQFSIIMYTHNCW